MWNGPWTRIVQGLSKEILDFHADPVHSNVNIPWPTKGMGDGDYMFAFQQVVMPIAYEFDPDLVIGA
jgi:acetoin utilization deacetylase AcuC-like enzyme